jgi:hypothetical protein
MSPSTVIPDSFGPVSFAIVASCRLMIAWLRRLCCKAQLEMSKKFAEAISNAKG